MSGEEVNLRRAVVLTAIPVEYKAIRAHLNDIRQERHEKGNIYERGTFLAGHHTWEVGIVEAGMGTAPAAVQAERAISHFKPILILFVGVAGGLKDVELGDVVVATKVYGYESGKANTTFQPRPEVGIVPYNMVELARSEARTEDWLKRLNQQIPHPSPRVLVAPIAAGGSVVTSTRSAIWQLLKENYSDAVAVEMESHGFLQAVHANPGVDALIIRGISDRIDDKTEADTNNFQEIASQHASAFAFEILAKLDTSRHLHYISQINTSLARRPLSEQDKLKRPLVENFNPSFPERDISNLCDEFYNALSNYHNEIKKVFSYFDSGQDIYEDQCDNTIVELNNLSHYLNNLNSNLNHLNLVIAYDLENLQNVINSLKFQLNSFRALCPPGTTALARRDYTAGLEKIRNEKNNFLERLATFKFRLNSDANLESK